MASGIVSSVVGVVLTGVTYPVYLHYLGYERYGLWLLLSIIITFSQIGNLGIAQALSKEVAEAFGAGDLDGVGECVTNALTLLMISGFIVLTALLIGKGSIVSALRLSPDNARLAAVMIPYVGLLSVYVFIVDATNATLAGLGRMDLCNYSQFAAQVIAAGVGIALLHSGAGIFGLLTATTLSYLCLHAASLYAIRRLFGRALVSFRFINVRTARHLLGFGLNLTAGSIVAMLLNPLNKIVLARYAGISTIPIYDLSFTGCMRIRNLFDSSQKAIIPEVSRLLAHSRAKAHQHARTLNRQSMRMLLFAAPLYAVLLAASAPLLRLWLGSRFDPSSPFTVRVMLIGAFASLAGMPAYYAFIGLGYARNIVTCNLVQFVVNIAIIAAGITLYNKASTVLVVSSTAIAMGCSSLYLIWSFARTTAQKRVALRFPAPIASVGSL